MTIKGKAVAVKPVPVTPPTAKVVIELDDAGEIRRLGRILRSFVNNPSPDRGAATDTFARELYSQLGYTDASVKKV